MEWSSVQEPLRWSPFPQSKVFRMRYEYSRSQNLWKQTEQETSLYDIWGEDGSNLYELLVTTYKIVSYFTLR